MSQPQLVITGGSRGIGHATALRFAAAGYRVINLSRRPLELPGARHIATDLTDEQQLASALTAVAAELDGSPTAVVHCAGLLDSGGIETLTAAVLRRSLEVNVVAAATINRVLLPSLGDGSAIVFVGSTLGEKAVPGSAAYVTAKHAQVGLMRSTCQDLAGRAIHTVCVAPGFTDTEMLRNHVGNDPAILDMLAGNVCQGRLIRPDEIAATILFAATNPVINGAVIHANLGQIEH